MILTFPLKHNSFIFIKMADRKTFCLNMIVKDESHIIRGTLEKLCKQIKFDYWVICDTGSTDGTQEIIKTFFEEQGIQGELLQHEWKDFGHNRTLALEGAYQKADYIFIFDADDAIYGDFKLPETLDADMYMLKFGNGLSYLRPLLVSARKKSKFVGVLHEFFIFSEPSLPSKIIEGNYYVDSGKSGARSKDANKYAKDAIILDKAFREEKDKGLAARYAFYCAQSYRDSNQTDKAIEWYSLVVDKLDNWVQEKYYACIMIGNMYRSKQNHIKSLEYYLKADIFDNERKEGVVFACELLNEIKLFPLVLSLYEQHKNYKRDLKDKLFMYTDVYNDFLEFNTSVAASYCGKHQLAYELTKEIIIRNVARRNALEAAYTNISLNPHQIIEDKDSLKLFYAVTNALPHSENNDRLCVVWEMLFKNNRKLLTNYSIIKKKKTPVNVFLSITSCKRLDLFQETVNSILNHWTDVDMVDYWFCVDDNSTEDDRKFMKVRYPWFEYYMKDSNEKGHKMSMNIIWNKLNELKPKYWIHMEDDFLFYVKRSYVKDSIDFLNKQTDIKQVLFNRAYAETMKDLSLKGYSPVTPGFVVHEYKEGNFPYPNCHYWPHYSFRPSMVDVETILKLGNFDSPNTFFERDYANKWYASGYRSAFFDAITCQHIGRLTSDKDTKTVKNAYDLNDELQFNTDTSSPIKVVNLKRRPDRKQKVEQLLKDNNIPSWDIFEAVDGQTLKATNELKTLFQGNDFNSRRGFIGCALSHYELWKQLLKDKTNDYYMIFEDDIKVSSNFASKFKDLQKDLHKFECLFIGYSMFDSKRQEVFDDYNKETNKILITKLNTNLYIGGTFAYSVNKKGAEKLVKYIEENHIQNGIDYLMVKRCKGLYLWELKPQIVFSDCYETVDGNVDTDIQSNYDSLDFSTIKSPLEEFDFYPKLDNIGNDLLFSKGTLEELAELALTTKGCVGFNTLGFFKEKIDVSNLSPSAYFSETDGLYVRKQTINKKKVKLICNWDKSEKAINDFKHFPMDDIELTWKDEADYYLIINLPATKDEYYDPKRTIVVQEEPWVYDQQLPWGVKTWGEWSSPDRNKFMKVFEVRKNLNLATWSFNRDLDKIPEKSNNLVFIVSHKLSDIGHYLRRDLALALENQIKIYGKENYHNFTGYQGPVPNEDRYEVYAPTKYVLAVENNFEENYATEKIWEPILCESLAFYWGCPNLEKNIPADSFVRLPLENPEECVNIIQKAISEDWWSQRISSIREAKRKILNELALFPTISKTIKEHNAVIIGGCVKNNANYLPQVFENIKKLLLLFRSYNIVIAYDESNDDSLNILKDYQRRFNMTILICNNKSKFGTENIASARNSILDFAKTKPSEYLIMMDMDDVSSTPIEVEVLQKYLSRDDWDALSFNRPSYYDTWALSIDDYQNSCWHYNEESASRSIETRKHIEEKLKNTEKDTLTECQSAFNGFAIYRSEKFKDCLYKWNITDSNKYVPAPPDTVKQEDCEHRSFHMEAIKKHGARIRISSEYLFDFSQETDCVCVSSRGMLKSCDVKSSTPFSSIGKLINYNISELKDGSIMYVCATALPEFINILETLPHKIVLVTGDCDWSLPNDLFHKYNDFLNFIESDKIIHWFAQNCVIKHPKMTPIPIGLDYHTVSYSDHKWSLRMSPLKQEKQLLSVMPQEFWKRELKCYANFQFAMNNRFSNDRKLAIEHIPSELVYYEPNEVTRYDSWKRQATYAFVVSPHGGGLDCHRTWEALCIGCIPIVKSSAIDLLYEDLPVLIVKEWKDVDIELLTRTVDEFKNKKFDYSKLTLEYWVNKFKEQARSSL